MFNFIRANILRESVSKIGAIELTIEILRVALFGIGAECDCSSRHEFIGAQQIFIPFQRGFARRASGEARCCNSTSRSGRRAPILRQTSFEFAMAGAFTSSLI
jgi:hypothetical protein